MPGLAGGMSAPGGLAAGTTVTSIVPIDNWACREPFDLGAAAT